MTEQEKLTQRLIFLSSRVSGMAILGKFQTPEEICLALEAVVAAGRDEIEKLQSEQTPPNVV